MYPRLFSIPHLPSYGAMLVLAYGAGWWVARRRARTVGIPPWQIDWLGPLLLLGAGLAARLGGRLGSFLSASGGNDRVLYGGLLAGVAIASGYAWVARISLGRLADAFAFSLPLGIALLRVGCFSGGCCWGDVCVSSTRLTPVADPAWQRQVQTVPGLCRADWPLAVTFPAGSPAYLQHRSAGLLPPRADRSLPVHPVQLYEMLACLALLGMLIVLDRRTRLWGETFLLGGLGYSLIRLVTDWFRADERLLAFGLTLSQYVSICVACACLLTWGGRVVLARRRPGGLDRRNAARHPGS